MSAEDLAFYRDEDDDLSGAGADAAAQATAEATARAASAQVDPEPAVDNSTQAALEQGLIKRVPGAPSRLRVDQIEPGENVRSERNPEAFAKLLGDVRAAGGVFQSILVRAHPTMLGMYQIIAGYGRHEAQGIAFGPKSDLPVVVVQASDADVLSLSLMENLAREEMSVFDQGNAFAKMVETHGDKKEAAKRLNLSVSQLDSRLAMRRVIPAIQQAYLKNKAAKIKLGHLELLAGLSPPAQTALLEEMSKKPVWISVEEMKKGLSVYAAKFEAAIFDQAGCNGCPSNSRTQVFLFDDSIPEGNCTNPGCFNEKQQAALHAKADALRVDYNRVEIYSPTLAATPVPLAAEGERGVGGEQYEACGACANRGALISADPASFGKVYTSVCFDPTCNARMVGLHKANQQRAAAGETEAAVDGAQPQDGGANAEQPDAAAANGKPAAKPAAKPAKSASGQTASPATAAKPSVVGAKVVEFRTALWREAITNAVVNKPGIGARVMLACLMDSAAVGGFKANEMLTFAATTVQAMGLSEPVSYTDMQAGVAAASKELLGQLFQCAAAEFARGVDAARLSAILKAYAIDLSETFVLSTEFLQILTKSEIGAIAAELGLSEKVGKKEWTAAMAGAKADLIKTVMTAAGSGFKAVPKLLQPKA